MATYRITAPDGGVYEITAPDDATQEQVLAYAQANYAQAGRPATGTQPRAQRSIVGDLARQVGLTGRYAMEGGAQLLDIPGAAIRGVLGGFGVRSDLPSETAAKAADWLGLPKPETALERGVATATRGGFSAAVPAGLAAKAAQGTSGATRAVFAGLAENPAAQIGGGAAGAASAEAAKDAGMNEYGQLVAGVLGGTVGGMAGNAAMKGAGWLGEKAAAAAGANPLPTSTPPRKMDDTQLSSVLRNRLSISGGDWDAIPANVQKSLMADIRKANRIDGLDADAMWRLADFRALEVTPTRGTVTLDPVQITREKNMAKVGASSNLANIQGLAQVENANNNRLIQLLQGVEGGVETDPTTAGRRLAGDIQARRDALRSTEQAAWDAAKAAPGYRMPMQAHVLSDVNAALDDAGMMPFMDQRISSYIQALQTHPDQFTPQAYRNLQSMLSGAMNGGGNEAHAARIARDVLEGATLKPAASQIPNPGNLPATARTARQLRATDPLPGDAMSLIDQARRATRNAYAFEDSSPLVRSTLADAASADPERIAKRFIIGGTADEAAQVARNLSPEGMQTVRNALATHIKRKALSGASDEMGNVSQKALNSAIQSLGPEKLLLFFTPDEVQQLQRLGRVASYMQVQPAGSAVNNSNSGALMVGKGIDLLTGISSKIPLLNIHQQIDSLVNVGRTAQALQAQKGILAPQLPEHGLLSNAGRGAVMGGLLSIPQEDTRAQNDKRK